jgi:hypothetical protein
MHLPVAQAPESYISAGGTVATPSTLHQPSADSNNLYLELGPYQMLPVLRQQMMFNNIQ